MHYYLEDHTGLQTNNQVWKQVWVGAKGLNLPLLEML